MVDWRRLWGLYGVKANGSLREERGRTETDECGSDLPEPGREEENVTRGTVGFHSQEYPLVFWFPMLGNLTENTWTAAYGREAFGGLSLWRLVEYTVSSCWTSLSDEWRAHL